MDAPCISIIIPVGPRHARYLPDALISCMAQDMPDWEALLIDDTADGLGLPAMPRVRVIPAPASPPDSPGPSRASRARNEGLRLARAPWVVLLDADDALTPGALRAMLRGAIDHPEACYVYGAWWNLRPDGSTDLGRGVYQQARLLQGNIHPITALIPTEVARQIGGFDPHWEIYEDYEFWLRLAVAGCCGVAIPEATLIYRAATGANRDGSHARKAEIAALLSARYGAYLRGERPMAGCCGGNSKALAMAKKAVGSPTPGDESLALGAAMDPDTLPGGRLRMEARDATPGWYKNPFGGSGETYRVSPGQGRYISAHPDDVEWLMARGFVAVHRPQYAEVAPLAPSLPDAPAPIAAAADEEPSPAKRRKGTSEPPREP